jgi:hypothetical protein
MLEIKPEGINLLRDSAKRGVPPSQMLRDLLALIDCEEPRCPILVWYVMDAFGLEQHQASSIFGWYPSPVGLGELSDSQLDYFLGRHLRNAGWPIPVSETAASE